MFVDVKQRATVLKAESRLQPGERIQTTRTSTADVVGSGWRLKLSQQSLVAVENDRRKNVPTLRLLYGVFFLETERVPGWTFVLGPKSSHDFRVVAPRTQVLVAALEDAQRFQALQIGEWADMPAVLDAQFLQWAVKSGEIRRGDHRLAEGDAYGVTQGQADHFPTHPGGDPVQALARAFHF